MATPIPINSANYDAMNTSIIAIITAGNYAAISIFTDASGTVYHTDEFGDINARVILGISRTDSYIDASGNPTEPYVIITFQEFQGIPGGQYIGSLLTIDDIDQHWYTLSSVPVPGLVFLKK